MSLNKYVSVSEFLMGRATLETLPPEYVANLNTLIPKVNGLLEEFGEYRSVRSGFRRPEDNAKVPKPVAKSAHLTCEAVDLADSTKKLANWILTNPEVLEKYDLYMEDPKYTLNWLHLQTRRPKSGNRIFIP